MALASSSWVVAASIAALAVALASAAACNGTVKIPASVFEAEGWTVAEKGILVVRYGENSTYDRAGWLKEGGVNYSLVM